MGKDCGADAGAYLGRTPNLWVAGDHRRKVDTACTCKTGAESYALGAPPVLQAEEKLDFFRAEFFTVQRTNHCFDWEKWRREDQLGHAVWYSSNDTGTQFFTNSVTEELLLYSDYAPERLERARTLLKKLGLYAYKDTHPAALSGGQKQRLSIACGILSDRGILIFDEPTSGLDGGNMGIVADVFRTEAEAGKTILVITHDRELMHRCCDDVVTLA